MPIYTIDEPGTYHVWAIATDQGTPVVITATAPGAGPDDEPLTVVHASPNNPVLPAMPVALRTTSGVLPDLPAGAVVSTRPDAARLILRRPGDLNALYDNGEPADVTPHRTLPKPRTGTGTGTGTDETP